MIDPQSVRLSEVRDLLRLMAQLGRLSTVPALWRTTLVNGLANILNMYVVGIFCFQERREHDAQVNPEVPEVCWAKPPHASASDSFPSPLKTHRAMRDIQKCSDGRLSPDRRLRMNSAMGSLERRSGNNQRVITELTFHDPFPAPLSIATVTYLLYSERPESDFLQPETLVTLLHSELHRHFVQHSEANGSKYITELLPERQQQILDKLLSGDGEKQIARQLGLSIHTVHSYIRRLYHRLNVSSRAELFRACYAPVKTLDGSPVLPSNPRSKRKSQ